MILGYCSFILIALAIIEGLELVSSFLKLSEAYCEDGDLHELS